MRRDLIALPEDSKVWVYQASLKIADETAAEIKDALYNFSMAWASHGKELDAYAHLFHSQFIVLVADGTNLPSGCSIDSSVHFIKGLGTKYRLDFFGRMIFTYMEDEVVKTVHYNDFADKIKAGELTEETLIFDNLVADKTTFISDWIKPVKESWHKKFL